MLLTIEDSNWSIAPVVLVLSLGLLALALRRWVARDAHDRKLRRPKAPDRFDVPD